MNMDKEHLSKSLYICRENPERECSNTFHARLYGYIAGRGDEADLEGFNSTTDEEMEKVLVKMGFEECPKLCSAGKPNGCFSRPKQTTTREENH